MYILTIPTVRASSCVPGNNANFVKISFVLTEKGLCGLIDRTFSSHRCGKVRVKVPAGGLFLFFHRVAVILTILFPNP